MAEVPNWIVICGALREPIDFKLTLAALVDLRRTGLAEGIVLSTWLGEVDAHPGLRENLGRMGVVVVESRDVQEPGPSNYWRQFKAWQRGFARCPERCNILKTRTDKVLPFLDQYLAYLRNGPGPLRPWGKLKPAFKRRIAFPHTFSGIPGSYIDMMFYGSRADMKRLTHFDGQQVACSVAEGLDPSFSWVLSPLSLVHPAFRTFYETFDARQVSSSLLAYAESGKTGELPDYLARMLAAHFVVTGMHVDLVADSIPPEDLSLHDLLGRRKDVMEILSPKTTGGYRKVSLKSSIYIQLALEGSLADDPDYAAFLRHAEAFQTLSSLDFEPAEADRAAVAAFCRSYGDPELGITTPDRISLPGPGNEPEAFDRAAALDCLDLEREFNTGDSERETAIIHAIFTKSLRDGRKAENAFYRIGRMYLYGLDGFPRNVRKAADWLRRSADRKFPEGKILLAAVMLEGLGVKSKDTPAIRLLQGLLPEGKPSRAAALFTVGREFYTGQRIEPDWRNARRFLKMAVDEGYGQAKQVIREMTARQHDAAAGPAPAEERSRFGLFVPVDRASRSGFLGLMASLRRQGRITQRPIVLTDDPTVVDDPEIQEAAERVIDLSGDGSLLQTELRARGVDAAARHRLLRLELFQDFGYAFNVLLDPTLLCLNPPDFINGLNARADFMAPPHFSVTQLKDENQQLLPRTAAEKQFVQFLETYFRMRRNYAQALFAVGTRLQQDRARDRLRELVLRENHLDPRSVLKTFFRGEKQLSLQYMDPMYLVSKYVFCAAGKRGFRNWQDKVKFLHFEPGCPPWGWPDSPERTSTDDQGAFLFDHYGRLTRPL